MKVLLELLFIFFLVFVGWRQPYRQHVERIFGKEPAAVRASTPAQAASRPARPASTPAPDSSWLWKPTKLDRPTR